jgi:hypothetical protein
LDDWSYGRSVKTLLEEGRLYYDGWNTPTLTLQVLYGALFCLPFGFSFETLRIASLVAGLAGGLGTYVLLREASASVFVAVIGSMTLMLNPAYFQHSFTFMTDVPFTALAVISAVFFLRSLRTGSDRDLVIGTVLASCATLVRQPGLAVPIGFGVTLLGTSTFDKRVLVRSVLPVAVTLFVLFVHSSFIDYLKMTPVMAGAFQESIIARLDNQGAIGVVWDAIKIGEALFAHISLFVLPCLLVLLACWLPEQEMTPRTKRLLFAFSPVLLLLLYWRFWAPDLPVRIFGMAHIVIHGPRPWVAGDEPHLFRQILWLFEMVATALMLYLIAAHMVLYSRGKRLGSRARLAGLIFGITTAFFLIAPFVLAGRFDERYLIPVIPFAVLVLVSLINPIGTVNVSGGQAMMLVGGIVILIAYSLVSIFYSHDYLLCNRVRWDAVNFLVHEKNIDPRAIDGGLAVNGWYLFSADCPLRERYSNWRSEGGGWWRNDAAEFVIGFSKHKKKGVLSNQSQNLSGPRPRIIWESRFDGWLPSTVNSMVVCREPGCEAFFSVEMNKIE